MTAETPTPLTEARGPDQEDYLSPAQAAAYLRRLQRTKGISLFVHADVFLHSEGAVGQRGYEYPVSLPVSFKQAIEMVERFMNFHAAKVAKGEAAPLVRLSVHGTCVFIF